MKQRLKPQLDMEAMQDDLIRAAVEEYVHTKSIVPAIRYVFTMGADHRIIRSARPFS